MLQALPIEQKFILILLFFGVAYLIAIFAGRIARGLVRLGLWRRRLRGRVTAERHETVRTIVAGIVRMLIFAIALISSLTLFVAADTVVWMIGLFSAAFGLGARPFISDILTGLAFIYENTYDVGEKVEMLGVSGVVERVNLRTTLLRSPSGELFVIPNGDIRVVRNFSRGKFSQLRVTLKIQPQKLDEVLPLLERLGKEGVVLLPNLIEPWQVLSEGDLGEKTTLTIVAKARFGMAAEMKPRLEALVQKRLEEANIDIG